MVAIVTLLASLSAYLIGSIPLGLMLVQGRGRNAPEIALSRPDVLAWVHPLGWKVGAVVLVVEALQGVLPTLCGQWVLGLDPLPVAVIALSALAGNLFSPYQRFRGGGGILTVAGIGLLFRPLAAAIGIAIFAAVFLRWGRATTAAVAGVMALCISMAALPGETPYRVLAIAMLLLVVYRQRTTLLLLLLGDDPTPPELAEQTLLMSRPPDGSTREGEERKKRR